MFALQLRNVADPSSLPVSGMICHHAIAPTGLRAS
jgi:hypothetical protein